MGPLRPPPCVPSQRGEVAHQLELSPRGRLTSCLVLPGRRLPRLWQVWPAGMQGVWSVRGALGATRRPDANARSAARWIAGRRWPRARTWRIRRNCGGGRSWRMQACAAAACVALITQPYCEVRGAVAELMGASAHAGGACGSRGQFYDLWPDGSADVCWHGDVATHGGWRVYADGATSISPRGRQAQLRTDDVVLRIGEAANPGPSSSPSQQRRRQRARQRCEGGMSEWGPAHCRTPFVGGFRHATALGFPTCPNGGQPDDMEHFALRAVTVNSTSWSSVVPFLRRTECDLVLLQEHRLGPEDVDDKAAWARRNGWNALFLPAERGPHGGWSAGVAILARKHLALSPPRIGTEVVATSRAMMALVGAP